MRYVLASAILAVLPGSVLAHCCDIRWPDPSIAVPFEVRSFIAAECRASRGSSEEDLASCIEGEHYGYRAVVAVLMDADTGDRAAELYRACRAGLGAEGGRFHRRRAECMGTSLGILWRFEFTRKASVEGVPRHSDFASLPVMVPHDEF